MSPPRLSDRVGVLGLGNGLALAVQLLLGIFLARAWSREELGSYLQVTLLAATVSPILFLGIPSSLFYFLPLYGDERRDRILLQSYVLLLALGGAGAAALALLAGPLAGGLNNPGLAPAIRCQSLALVGMLPAAVAYPLLVSLHRDRAAALVTAGTSLAEAAVAAGAVAARAPLTHLFLALAGLQLALGAAVGGLVLRTVGRARPRGFRPRDHLALLAEQLRYAVPFATAVHANTLNRFLDRYLIGLFFAPALFAVYAVGAKEVPVVPLVIASVNIVLQQRLTTLERDGRAAEILPTWHAAMRKQGLLVLPVAVALCLLAEPFVTGLYSDRYRDSVPVFRVYLGLLALRVATWPMVLAALGRSRSLFAGSAVALGTNAAVSLALVKPLGLLGPAVGAVAGALAGAAYALVRTRALLGVPWGRLLPWSTLLALAGSAAGAGALLAPFVPLFGEPLPALAGGVAYAVVFGGLARAAGVLRGDDVALIRSWLVLRPLRGAGGG